LIHFYKRMRNYSQKYLHYITRGVLFLLLIMLTYKSLRMKVFDKPMNWVYATPNDEEQHMTSIGPQKFTGRQTIKVLLWDKQRYGGDSKWGDKLPEGRFIFDRCPVSTCTLSANRESSDAADLVVFSWLYFDMPTFNRPKDQLWMVWNLESPPHSKKLRPHNIFNWTATYRWDSTLVVPYVRWFYYDLRIKFASQTESLATNKTRKVAWFVSNCNPSNKRFQYFQQLSKHIEIDVYGRCGNFSCKRGSSNCDDIVRDYKFYLAFENSNCNNYITEKAFYYTYRLNVIPVVLGARGSDYEKMLPEGSYIHVDQFESPAALAEHLHRVDQNDTLYNQYFQWKGKGEFVTQNQLEHTFFCQLCALLHSKKERGADDYYEDINKWYSEGVCRQHSHY